MVSSALIGRRRSISATSLFNTAPGRVVNPSVVGLDPQSQGLIQSNTTQLAQVSRQVESLSIRVNQLSTSLQGVRNSLATSEALDRQRERQEQLQQARLAQQKLREGKESAIEKKITAAAMKPAITIANKARNSLFSLGNLFQNLLGAFLTFKAVETIQALATGNTEKLEEIKGQVLTAVGGFIGLKLAIKAATGTMSLGFLKFSLALAGLAAIVKFREPIGNFLDGIFYPNNPASNPDGLPKPGEALEENTTQPNTTEETQTESTEQANTPPTSTEQEPQVSSTYKANWWDDLVTDSTPTSMPVPAPPEPKTKSEPTETVLGNKVEPPPPVNGDSEGSTPSEQSTENGNEQPEVQPKPGLSAEELKQYNRAYANKDNFLAKGQIKAAWNKMTPEQKAAFLAHAREQGHDWSDYGFTAPAKTQSKNLSREQQFRRETAAREALPENQIGAKATDPEILAMIEQEKYIGKTGQLPPNIFEPTSNRRTVAQNVSQQTDRQSINVVPMPQMLGSEEPPKEVNSASGNIGGSPGISIPSSNPDNPYILGALAQYNVVA